MQISISRLIVTFFILCWAQALVAAPKKVLDIQTWKSDLGVPVYFIQSQSVPMVDIKLMFSAGSSYDGEFPGLAYLTNAMLSEGTKRYDKTQIVTGFDSVGAQFGSSVTRDMATLSLRSLTEASTLQPAIKLFQQIVVAPTFPEENFKRLQAQTLQGLKKRQEQSSTVASDLFYNALYQDQPYGHPTVGTPDSINALTPDALKNFYDTFYTAQHAKLVIVGDLSVKQAKQLTHQLLAGLTQHANPVPGLPAAKPNTQKRLTQTLPVPQTAILIGKLGIAPGDKDFFKLLIGNTAFGRLPLLSILFEQVRIKNGYAYGVYSYFSPLALTGPFVVRLQTKNEQVDDAVNLVNTLLKKLGKQGITQAQFDTSKQYLLGQFPLNFDSNAAMLNQTATLAFYNLALNYFDTYRSNIEKTTLKEVNQALAKHFNTQDWITVTAGGQTQVAPR